MKYPSPTNPDGLYFDEHTNQVSENAVPYQVDSAPFVAPLSAIDIDALGQDIEQQLSNLSKHYQHAQKQLLARHKHQLQQQHIEPLIESLGAFDDANSITRLELIRRYAVLRKQVRDKVEFVGAKELAAILDENKTNWTRDLANLYKKGKLLAVRRLGSNNWEYPLNQIDPHQGAIYPPLESLICQAKQQGSSDWDILIWLNLPTIPHQSANPVLVNANDSVDALLSDFDGRKAPKALSTVLPIELLQQGKYIEFERLAEDFLQPQVSG